MKTIISCLGLLSIPVLIYTQSRVPVDSIEKVDRIAIGACNHQGLPQEMWLNILEEKPDLFVFMGDNIYGNSSDTSRLRKKYRKQLLRENYEWFLSKVPVIGTWDDHDYGKNNSDSTNPIRKESQQLFLDFIGEPAQTQRRKQKGIYTSYTFGRKNETVQFILLDTRYFRGKPGANSDLLGEEQWKWLENTLRSSSAQVKFIVTSTQFLSDKKNKERWEQFPAAKKRMMDLIKNTQTEGMIFLSGDIHCGEILRYTGEDVPYPIYEFTSSGLTHSRWHSPPRNTQNKVYKKPFCHKNYGLITISWNDPVSVKFEIRDIQNFMIQEISIYLDDLKTRE